MTKMTDEQKQFRKMKRGSKNYWMTEALKIRQHRLMVKWVRKGVPELTAYANGFHKGVAFVMGNGPSLASVKKEQWDRLAKFFTAGVNKVPYWLQKERGISHIPSLALCVDYIAKGDVRVEWFDGPFSKMSGKRLVAFDCDGIPHDWAIPHFQGDPIFDLDLGIFLTVKASDPRWSRSTAGMIWLCYMLGFKAIFLLGADHGTDYQNKYEMMAANEAYRDMRLMLNEKGVRLANVGAMSSVSSLETFRLDDVLDQSEEMLTIPS